MAGAVGYIGIGLAVPGLPDWCLGFVSLPALAGIVVSSLPTAPLGFRLAHSLPVDRLKRAFAILLLVAADAWPGAS